MPTLPDPFGGLHTDTAVGRQPRGTTRHVSNVRPVNTDGSRQISTRGGHEEILGGSTLDSSGAAVRAMTTLTRQKKLTTYSERTTPETNWSYSSDTVRGVKAPGDTYWLIGRDKVGKRNSAGVELWCITLPLVDETQEVRAFDVSPDGTIFCGVSEGDKASEARIWSYAEVRAGEAPVRLAEISGIGFVQDCVYQDGYLYTIQDYPDENRSSLVIYREALSGAPAEDSRNDQIAWPTSGLAVGPEGSVYIASPESFRRGASGMPKKKSFELGDLNQLGSRLWAHHRSDTPSTLTTYDDGDEVTQIDDLSGNGRHLTVRSTKAGAEYIAREGKTPVLRFDPNYVGAGGTGSAFRSLANITSNTDPERIFTTLPSYADGRFAAFFLLRRTSTSTSGIEMILKQGFGGGSKALKLRANYDEGAGPLDGFVTLTEDDQTLGGGSSIHHKDGVYEEYILVTLLWNVDGAGSSYYRVNGTPWSAFNLTWDTEGSTTEQTDFGFSSDGDQNGNGLSADLIEVIVLRDYEDDETGETKLITYPDYPAVPWSTTSDTEVERIEGMMAWEYGVQDYLDDGTETSLDVSTAQTQPWPHPFHLRKRFVVKDAAWTNADNRVTKTGAFSNYAQTQAAGKSDTIDVYETTSGTLNRYVIVSADPGGDWIELASKVDTVDATVSCVFTGFIGLDAEASTGGPPEKSGRPTSPGAADAYWRNNTSYPAVLEKWSGGKLEWNVARTGGVGHAVHVRSIDDVTHVWSYGPNYLNDTIFLRRVDDQGVDQSLLGAPLGTVVVPDYKWARMAADKLGTIYFPFTDGDSTYGVNSIGWTNLDFSYGLRAHNIDGVGYAVAPDPNVPDYDTDSVFLSEYVYVGSSGQHRLRMVDRALDAGSSPRERIDLGLAAGNLYRFDSGAPVLIGAALAADSPWSQMHEFMGEVFMTDGASAKVYTSDDTLEDWSATSAGELPRGFKLMMVWNGYIWVARTEEDPFFWARSEKDNARGWDLSPVTVTVTQAAAGPLSPAGRTPHLPTALIPWTDATRDERTGSLAVIGCDHSIWMMEGEVAPGAGGTIYMKTPEMGIAFGIKPWAISRQGILYFINDSGQFCRWQPGGMPTPISEGRVDQRFQNINLSKYMPRLEYDRIARGVHVFLTPLGATHDEKLEHYFFCEESHGVQDRGLMRTGAYGSFWPQSWETIGHQPVSSVVRDGDDPDDRELLIGCSDGYVRSHGDHADDDGSPIMWDVTYGPIIGNETREQGLFNGFQVELDESLNGATVSVYAQRQASKSLSQPAVDFRADPGLNGFVYKPVRGSYCYVRLRGTSRSAVEAVRVEVTPAGFKRRRG